VPVPSANASSGGQGNSAASLGKLDQEALPPGGEPRTTNLGLNAVGNEVYDVQLGQPFVPGRSGNLQAVGFNLGKASAEVTLTIYATKNGYPDMRSVLGTAKLGAADLKGFDAYSYFRFSAPIALSAGTKYVAALSAPGAVVPVQLTTNRLEAGKLQISFAPDGGEHLSWQDTPDNGGYEFAGFRTYMDK
jgi:hypothetical protein